MGDGYTIRISRMVAVVAAIGVGALLVLLAAYQLRLIRPAGTVDLFGKPWAIVAVNGVAISEAHPATLTLSLNGEATIDTGCTRAVAHWGYDSDGDSIGFSDIPSAQEPCADGTEEQDDLILHALAATRTWGVVSTNTVELRGGDTITLQRPE